MYYSPENSAPRVERRYREGRDWCGVDADVYSDIKRMRGGRNWVEVLLAIHLHLFGKSKSDIISKRLNYTRGRKTHVCIFMST